MADQTFFQSVIAEVVSFFELIADVLGEDAARAAVIKDLGGNPDAAVGELVFPTAPLDSIKAYRDASNPSAEADAAVIADVVAILDALASNIETWAAGGVGNAAEELVASFIDLMATNYVRLRWPRFFLIMQSADHARRDHRHVRRRGEQRRAVVDVDQDAARVLVQPRANARAAQPGGGSERAEPAAQPPPRRRHLPAAVPPCSGSCTSTEKWKDITGDVLAGWDAPGLDLDSDGPGARRRHHLQPDGVVLVRAGDRRLRGRSRGRQAAAASRSPTFRHCCRPRACSSPSAATSRKRSRSANGGRSAPRSAATPVSPRCSATHRGCVDRSTTPTSPPASGSRRAPTRSPTLSFSIPRPTGTRLDIGSLALSALAHEWRRRRSRVDERLGVRHRRLRQRQLRAQAARRRAAAAAVQHHARLRQWPRADLRVQPALGEPERSRRAELAARRRRPGRQRADRGHHPARASLRTAHHPRGRRCACRGRRRCRAATTTCSSSRPMPRSASPPARCTSASTASASASCSTRASRPTPNNLRFFDARLAISPPLGIAVQVDTQLVSGGGTIFHDTASGTYFGVLALRLGSSFTLKAFGLVSTKNADGTPGSSFIIIGTLEGLGWQIGPGHRRRPRSAVRLRPHVRRERRAHGAADRPAQVPAVPDRSGAPHHRDHAPAARRSSRRCRAARSSGSSSS